MRFWWLTDSTRLGHERRTVEALARDEQWLVIHRWKLVDYLLTVEGVIRAGDAEYPIRLRYPDQFPSVPAWVEPQDPTARWSSHQYGAGGVLCLELRPDNWNPSATGADVLRSAYHLLNAERPLSSEAQRTAVPSAHHVGEIQTFGLLGHPLLIGESCLQRLRSGANNELRALRWDGDGDSFAILILDADDESSGRVAPPPGMDRINALPVLVVRGALPTTHPASRQELIATGAFSADAIEQLQSGFPTLVVFSSGIAEAAFHVLDDGPPYRRRISVIADDEGIRSGRTPEMATKRVAIVGAGSVGSKLAECLVRSGVARVLLVDGDVLVPGNLERHSLDWVDIGQRKANALRRRLLRISPAAAIDTITENLSWQRSAKVQGKHVSDIGGCELIVDATGDAATSLFLGAIAHANGRPFVSVEVFEGGIGVLVASCLPDRDPSYADARAAFLAWCADQPSPLPEHRGRRYEAFTGDGTPLAADDAAVTVAAGHCARVVLDILRSQPAERAAAWILVGLRAGWVFDGHGHTIRLSVGTPTPTCAEDEDREARAFATELVQEALGASPDST